jgi:hypothetical protein
LDQQFVMSRGVRVAAGRFGPGHLGELTQLIPFEMVDAALEATRRTQARVRDLPSRVVVYLLLAGCLFPQVGYLGVWSKLTASLAGMPGLARPTAGALAQARARLGPAPLAWLFELLRGPAALARDQATYWGGLLVVAIDGTVLTVPDTPSIGRRLPRHAGGHAGGGAGYPQVRVLALVACGTRTIIDAVFGPISDGETTYAPRLLRSLRSGMLLLADRGFDVADLLAAISTSGADVLVRIRNNRRMPVLTRLDDGSYLSVLSSGKGGWKQGGLKVRVIDCEVTITTTDGTSRTSLYRLATTLTDHRRHPASGLIVLYHQRWEIETAFLEIKSTILGGRVLRARTHEGITQEIYALLISYQLLRTAMADATSTQPGTDPDRAGFTTAWQTACDQVILAAGVIADTRIDLAGTIGRHVLASLLPARRLRVSPRIVKRAYSKFQARGPRINRTSYQATTSINIIQPGQT